MMSKSRDTGYHSGRVEVEMEKPDGINQGGFQGDREEEGSKR